MEGEGERGERREEKSKGRMRHERRETIECVALKMMHLNKRGRTSIIELGR